MVFAIPATAVLAGAVMLILANATWDGLVADDYYRRGMEINRSLARDAEATHLGLEAVVTFPKPGVVEARLTTEMEGAIAAGDRLDLRFAHAARAGADVIIPMVRDMTRDPDGAWHGALPPLPPGKWYVELGNDQWRLTAPARMPAPRAGIVLHATEAEAPNDNSL